MRTAEVGPHRSDTSFTPGLFRFSLGLGKAGFEGLFVQKRSSVQCRNAFLGQPKVRGRASADRHISPTIAGMREAEHSGAEQHRRQAISRVWAAQTIQRKFAI